MAPSELNRLLDAANERLKTAYTVAVSLLTFAVGSAIAVFAIKGIAGLATTSAVIATIGGIGALAASRLLVWQRCDVYDEVVLAGFRHVGGAAVARHTAELVSAQRRQLLAATLERFLEISLRGQLGSVPLDRHTVRALEPNIRGLCARVRAIDVPVDAAGMVLLRRLITDGATSPLFHMGGPKLELERAIDQIHAMLGPMPVIQLFPAASTEPLRLAA